MKKLIALGIAMTMMLSVTSGAYAAGSINKKSRDITVVEEKQPSGKKVVVEEPDSSKIENKEVKNIVEQINGKEKITPAETAARIEQAAEKKDAESFPTNEDFSVNLNLYDYITPYFSIETEEKNQDARIKVPAAKGLDATDVMLLHVDSVSGEISVIIPKDFDAKTGEMTAKVPGDGLIAVSQKIPVVVRNTHPEDYNDVEVAEAIEALPEDEFVELSDWLEAFHVDEKELTVAEGKTVDIDDFSAANYIADIAVRFGPEQFGYNLTTKLNAKLYQQLDDIDYEKILDYAGVDYDADEVRKDRTALEEIEPFTLENCFVYHVDATTGERSIAYEPEIFFQRTDEEESAADSGKRTVEREKSVITWDVEDIDNDDDDRMNIVIVHDKYLGMGPFILLMPKDGSAAK